MGIEISDWWRTQTRCPELATQPGWAWVTCQDDGNNALVQREFHEKEAEFGDSDMYIIF
jgi:hypothetical protein